MDNKKYLDFIAQCEKEYNVSAWKIGSMHLWPIIRCYLCKAMVKNKSKNKLVTELYNIIKARINHTWNFIKDWKNNALPISRIDILFFGNGATKSLFKGKWYDYLVQPILEEHLKLGDKCIFIERGIFYRYPRSYKSFLTRVFEEIAGVFAAIISAIIPKNLYLPHLDKLLLDIEISAPYMRGSLTKAHILRYALGVKFTSYFYSLILAITKPKIVYIVCYYSMSGMAMCFACARKKIPTVEIQHGNTHNNFAYQKWTQSPKTGYNTIPKIYWFWTSIDQKEFKRTNSKKFLQHLKNLVGGMPWIDFWKSADSVVCQYISMLAKESAGYKYNILITLRPDIFGDKEWDKLVKLIEETKGKIFWWIRKHPTSSEIESSLLKICSVRGRNVNHNLASTLPLFSLLRFVNLHITTASNVAVEAKLFDVDTVFISELARLEMPHLIDNRTVKVITDIKRLKSMLLRKG